jgi:TRAP-type C4-dicarboxylate transport system permease small subunit
MFACVFLVFVYKIAMRYAGGDAVAWADEVSVVLFVWIIFWANAFVVKDRRQITFDLVYRLLSPSARRASRIAPADRGGRAVSVGATERNRLYSISLA